MRFRNAVGLYLSAVFADIKSYVKLSILWISFLDLPKSQLLSTSHPNYQLYISVSKVAIPPPSTSPSSTNFPQTLPQQNNDNRRRSPSLKRRIHACPRPNCRRCTPRDLLPSHASKPPAILHHLNLTLLTHNMAGRSDHSLQPHAPRHFMPHRKRPYGPQHATSFLLAPYHARTPAMGHNGGLAHFQPSHAPSL